MATKAAKKPKADANIAPPGVGTATAAPTPAAPVAAPAQGGSALAALLAKQNVTAAPKAAKKGNTPEVERKDLANDIHEFCVGSFTKKEGESQMALYGDNLRAEAEKERLALCIKDKTFHKSCIIGDLTFKVGSFSILIQPKVDALKPENSVTDVQIDQLLMAAFGTLENARKYTFWREEMRFKLDGKTEEEKLDIVTFFFSPEAAKKQYNKADIVESVQVLALKVAGDSVLLMEDYSKNEVLTVASSFIKVRDAVALLKSPKFGLLAQSGGSLTPDQEAMIRIGTEKAEAEKKKNEALQKLAEMQAANLAAKK